MSYNDDITAPFRFVRDRYLNWCKTPAKSRVDRSRMYCWVHCGFVIAGIALFIKPFGPGALSIYDSDTNKMLSICLLLGSFFALLGSLMGTRFWFPSAQTDVRLPYFFAIGGQISVVSALLILILPLALHSSTLANAAGAIQFTIVMGCAHTAIVSFKEIYRINRLERIVRDSESS